MLGITGNQYQSINFPKGHDLAGLFPSEIGPKPGRGWPIFDYSLEGKTKKEKPIEDYPPVEEKSKKGGLIKDYPPVTSSFEDKQALPTRKTTDEKIKEKKLYENKWVVIYNDKIVASHENKYQALEKAREQYSRERFPGKIFDIKFVQGEIKTKFPFQIIKGSENE